MNVRLHLDVRASADRAPRHREPVTFGLPMPRGAWSGAGTCTLAGEDGHRWPVTIDVRDRWSDGSARWVLVQAFAEWPGHACTATLEVREPSTTDDGEAERTPVVATRETGGALSVETGAATFRCARDGAFPFADVRDAAGAVLLETDACGLRVRDAGGGAGDLAIEHVDLEESSPIHAVVRWRGRVSFDRQPHGLEVDARARFAAGSGAVRLSVTIRNPRAARHPGNLWELGDSGSVLLGEATLWLRVPGSKAASVQASLAGDEPLAPCAVPFSVVQASSGGECWDSPVHVDRHGRVPLRFRGYQLTGGGNRPAAGLRAEPIVTVATEAGAVSVAVPGFWQNFPGSVSAEDGTLAVGLWPETADAHELQGGEQKTHEVAFVFGHDVVTSTPLAWCRTPLLVRADPAWYCESGVIPHLVPESHDPSRSYVDLVRAAIEGADTFVLKRERIDEYGWRHFGDFHADHEAVSAPAGTLFVSHYNNQYDAVAGCGLQYLRSGDPRWWSLCSDLAAHVADIDLYHTSDDKAAYSGGPFWHTAHYVHAGRSTHRAYPAAPGVRGGGPGNEHNYSGGLLLHYFLTGSPVSREAVVQLADWVLRIDDGRQSPFRWLSSADTGLSSATRDPLHHGPGRGAANSIATLLDAHRVTGRDVYLEKAEALIRRCVHPADDIDARRLGDIENRWSYTVFLLVLGRYLVECAETGRTGRTYAWARRCLARYGAWMAEHERPYLDTPEQLEFPTETWAAQDMRKCDVLLLASLVADEPAARARLRERAVFFFEESVRRLREMPTRTFTRPVVILLSLGFRRAWFDRCPDAALPDADAVYDFGTPVPFVPQRVVATRRARWIAGVLGASGVAGLALAARWMGWLG